MQSFEIFQKIGELLWKIMPSSAYEIIYRYMFYPAFNQGGAHWLDNQKHKKYFDNSPMSIYQEINLLLEKLNKHNELRSKAFNHFYITLSKDANFIIRLANIDEEDSWQSLYLKGINDLKAEEIDEYYVPIEIWQEMVRLKKQSLSDSSLPITPEITEIKGHLDLLPEDRASYHEPVKEKPNYLVVSAFEGIEEGRSLGTLNALLVGAEKTWPYADMCWQEALSNGRKVELKLKPIYVDNQYRPEFLVVEQSIDGKVQRTILRNPTQG